MGSLRRSRFQRTGGGSRRRTSWFGGPRGGTGVLSSSGSLLIATGFQIVADGITLVRTRGELLVQLETVGAAGDGWRVAAGLCIVSENAFGVGITAVPTPIADDSWDGWLWYWTGTLSAVSANESEVSSSLAAQARIVIDSKAMRKVKASDVIIAVVEIVESGTITGRATIETRMLAKLQ